MFRFYIVLFSFVIAAGVCAAPPEKTAVPLTPSQTFAPLLPVLLPPSDYAAAEEAAALQKKRTELIGRLLAERRKYLVSDAEAREKHEEILKKIHTLTGLFEHKRRIRELVRDLELLEQKIRALEPAGASKSGAETAASEQPPVNPFRPRYATNLEAERFADPEQAGVLFKLREDVLLKLLEERRKTFESDPKAAALAGEIMKLSKEFAVRFETRPAVREITRELRLVDAGIQALPKVPPKAKASPAAKAPPAAKEQVKP